MAWAHNQPCPGCARKFLAEGTALLSGTSRPACHHLHPPPTPLVLQVAGLQGGAAPWVAFGKHLCGAATDFTLRSCARELQRQRRQGGAGAPAGRGVRGLAVATCCHHRCSWQHFVAQQDMGELGFSPEEFEVIAWMTGEGGPCRRGRAAPCRRQLPGCAPCWAPGGGVGCRVGRHWRTRLQSLAR